MRRYEEQSEPFVLLKSDSSKPFVWGYELIDQQLRYSRRSV